MTTSRTSSNLILVGVALEGRSGWPQVVLEDSSLGAFLSLAVSPFDAEFLIRDRIGDGEHTALSWMVESVTRRRFLNASIEPSDDDRDLFEIRLRIRKGLRVKIHRLGLAEGLSLVTRLGLPLSADAKTYIRGGREIQWLSGRDGFRRDFLFLNQPAASASTMF